MKTQFFFHTKTEPRVTVGAVLNLKTNVLKFSTFEFNDKPFCRRHGRAAVIGRIAKDKTVATAKVNVNEGQIPGRVFVRKSLELCCVEPELELA